MQVDDDELRDVLGNLLRIAKVAMPADLYHQDSRVRAGLALLNAVKEQQGARVPNIPRPSDIRIANYVASHPVEVGQNGLRFALELPWDVLQAVHRWHGDVSPIDLEEAVTFVLRDILPLGGPE